VGWLGDSAVARLRAIAAVPDLGDTRYELMEEIGRGGMGVVYLARDTQLERQVAVKVLNATDGSGEAPDRLLAEARILARLEHPGIVPVHDAGALPDGRIYYAMKLVQGTQLDRFSETKPPLPELLRTFCRVCEPVGFAHSQGVFHRDLKPSNIMVGKFGEVLVLDWGLALDGMTGGTPEFMAPEQARGDSVNARSDVYALGKTLAFLLRRGAPAPKPLVSIIRKATSPDAELRYSGALELADDVARFLDGVPVLAHKESIWEGAQRFASRNKVWIALMLTYVVVRAVLFFWLGR
jgi:serine/threonine protein kinase